MPSWRQTKKTAKTAARLAAAASADSVAPCANPGDIFQLPASGVCMPGSTPITVAGRRMCQCV